MTTAPRKDSADLSDIAGSTVSPWSYAVGREKIREFASAVGEDAELYYDYGAASDAGFRDIVAPPMFVVVYSRWMAPVIRDPRFGIDYEHMLHGGQEFRWGEPVCAGDLITTDAVLVDAFRKKQLTFYVLESTSLNQHGALTARGVWTMIVRGSTP